VADVSVVVPTRDRSALLRRTLGSVLRQDDVSFEVIVVDDGSGDDTPTIVETLGDQRVRYVRFDTPHGVSVARNRGAAEATARWLAFVDDDDLWAPTKLSSQLAAARATDRAWAYTGSVNMTVDDVVVGGAPPLEPDAVAERLPSANVVPGGCSGVLLDREALEGEEPFDAGYRHFADWDLWIRLARRGLPAAVTRPDVGYRIHATNASHDTEGMVAELDVIERRYGGPVDRLGFLRHVARVSRRGGRRRQALAYYLRAAKTLESRYLLGAFPRDVGEVVVAALREQLGQPPRPAANDGSANAAWLIEAQAWIDALAARPAAGGDDSRP
jgi:glycosyltransferase involved in cell wall biosynthesis